MRETGDKAQTVENRGRGLSPIDLSMTKNLCQIDWRDHVKYGIDLRQILLAYRVFHGMVSSVVVKLEHILARKWVKN